MVCSGDGYEQQDTCSGKNAVGLDAGANMTGFAEIQEGAPTADQLTSILEYLGPSKAGSVIENATGTTDALRKFKQNESLFQRPVTVDWNNGRAGRFSSDSMHP